MKMRFACCLLWVILGLAGCGEAPSEVPEKTARPALTVQLLLPAQVDWPQTLAANGNVLAWQESVIGAEIAGYRLAEIRVEVGDEVRKGQVLARIDPSTVQSEVAEARSVVRELEAAVSEARANAERSRALQARGFYSQQMHNQYETLGQGAEARLAAARARLQAAELRLARTEIVAPDAGIISARLATVGSLTQAGEPLFRLIRGGRLEWQAEVPAADLARVTSGAVARLVGPAGERVEGVVRQVAPAVDPQTRNGLVYVDLPPSTAIKAGMFVRGELLLGQAPARVVPESAVVQREGFAYVFRLEEGGQVAQTKVSLGRRQGERVEIVDGLPEGAQLVASGVAFLADGDRVRIAADARP